MVISKRLLREFYLLHKNNYKVIFPICNETLNLYYLILFGNKQSDSNFSKLSIDIIREYIFPFLVYHQNLFWIDIMVNDKIYNLKFNIPKKYPFAPPTIFINNVSLSRIKDIGNNEHIYNDIFRKLINIYNFIYINFSPVTKLKTVINYIINAISIHLSLNFKTNFLKSLD